METSNVEEKIRKYIAESFLFRDNGYPYDDQVSFLENGILDSMNVMELVVFVEETFSIKVEDSEIVPENFDSISNLSRYVRQKAFTAA